MVAYCQLRQPAMIGLRISVVTGVVTLIIVAERHLDQEMLIAVLINMNGVLQAIVVTPRVLHGR